MISKDLLIDLLNSILSKYTDFCYKYNFDNDSFDLVGTYYIPLNKYSLFNVEIKNNHNYILVFNSESYNYPIAIKTLQHIF
jgi:hypothetical protein